MGEEKDFIVDFESWIITAKDEDEVIKIVEKEILENEIPRITLIEEN